MLRPDLKASAQLAWQNFVARHPDKTGGMTEDDFIVRIEELEKGLRSGLIHQNEYDEKLSALLNSPEASLEIATYTPPKRSTDELLRELTKLHKDGILTDDEFAERKGELFFERNVEVDPDDPIQSGDANLERRNKLHSYVEELQAAGVIDAVAADTARARIDQL